MLFVCIKNLFNMPTTDKRFVHKYKHEPIYTHKPEPLSEVKKKQVKKEE